MAPERCNVHKMQIIFRMRFNINFLTLSSSLGVECLFKRMHTSQSKSGDKMIIEN